MSSLTSNSSHARSRSLRSNTLKPPTTTLAPQCGPTSVNLFVRNLRLLDLDLRDDWPDITALTFSTKDAQQNQKKRIQCVEWALYRLFAIWDPEETRNVLSFTPAEAMPLTVWPAETSAVLSSSRSSSIPQSTSCPLSMSRTSQESRCARKRCGVEKNHAG